MFSRRTADRDLLIGQRTDGRPLHPAPIGRWLHQLGQIIAGAARSGAGLHRAAHRGDVATPNPMDKGEPAPLAVEIKNALEIDPDVDDPRVLAEDRSGSPGDSPPGPHQRDSDGTGGIGPIEGTAEEPLADDFSVAGVAAGPTVHDASSHDPALIDGEESTDTENEKVSAYGQFPSSQTEHKDSQYARTMVESLLISNSDQKGPGEYLGEGLADIFVKKEIADPRVQALLRCLDHVDCRQLADELRAFADSIGATPEGQPTAAGS